VAAKSQSIISDFKGGTWRKEKPLKIIRAV